MDFTIAREKLDQAVAVLGEQQTDAWLTLTRETSLTPDPSLALIAGLGVTWHSAFLVSRGGARVAIVGRHDAENVRAIGGYTEVIGYDQSLRPALRDALARLDPQSIAVNYSETDPAADGLSHGLWRFLAEALADTPYGGRLIPAEKLITALRGRKSDTEVKRIAAAIRTTERLLADLSAWLRLGQTEKQIAQHLTEARKALELETAWDEAYCPVVNAGPHSAPGHALPGRYKAARGQLLHVDFGVRQAGFCSDLQRVWYFPKTGERRAPDDIRRAWDACWAALLAGAERLRVGVQGFEVDAAARSALATAGYPEYQHALGHQLGRVAHDGSTLLGPQWDRYGQAPLGRVEAGNVFTLELGTAVPGRGFIGLEEDVLVTPSGLRWLSKPQRQPWLV